MNHRMANPILVVLPGPLAAFHCARICAPFQDFLFARDLPLSPTPHPRSHARVLF